MLPDRIMVAWGVCPVYCMHSLLTAQHGLLNPIRDAPDLNRTLSEQAHTNISLQACSIHLVNWMKCQQILVQYKHIRNIIIVYIGYWIINAYVPFETQLKLINKYFNLIKVYYSGDPKWHMSLWAIYKLSCLFSRPPAHLRSTPLATGKGNKHFN